MIHLATELPRHPALKSTPQKRHRWHGVGVRGGGTNVCERCGVVVTNFRNRETNHFELRYHHPEGVTETARICK